MPVEPWERWETDTPWLARRPPKFQRFMPPAKPLPIVVPETSTNWPGTKWSAVISAPTSIRLSSDDAELGDLALRLDLGALAKWPRSRLGDVLHLGLAGAELHGGIAVLLRGALRDDLAVVELAARSPGTCSPSSVKTRVMPSFCAITPERIAIVSVSSSILRA